MRQIHVGDRIIGDGAPVFVIAEVGYNFRKLDEALASVDAAADAGADGIKIQTFRARTLVSRGVDFPAEAGGTDQYGEFEQYEIDEETHQRFFERARARHLVPFSTPSHTDDVALLERLDCPLYKIGSDDLTNLPLLRHVGSLGKPVIISSGMATLGEVDQALRTLWESGNDRVILLQCVSNYPIRDLRVLNLRVLETYRRCFSTLVGLSDHSMTTTAAVAAVALGACVVERHFTVDKALDVPDAAFSADPTEMAALVGAIREAEAMLGDGVKRPTATEQDMRRRTRKSIFAGRPIPAGHVIESIDLIIKRPAIGITPGQLDMVVGRSARRDIAVDEAITWDVI